MVNGWYFDLYQFMKTRITEINGEMEDTCAIRWAKHSLSPAVDCYKGGRISSIQPREIEIKVL